MAPLEREAVERLDVYALEPDESDEDEPDERDDVDEREPDAEREGLTLEPREWPEEDAVLAPGL